MIVLLSITLKITQNYGVIILTKHIISVDFFDFGFEQLTSILLN